VVINLKLSELGERKAIELIRRVLGDSDIDKTNRTDDCAVLDFGDEYLLVTTDMISKGTHIPKKAIPWQMGWHAAGVNLSDIAAMGGKPIGILAALGLPRDSDIEILENMMEGMRACCEPFDISVLGGDTKEAEQITISCCAFGRVPKSEIMLRKGAKSGDILAVTGELGGAGAAYHALKNDMEEERAIKDLLEVHPRIKEGITLAKTGAVTSCMDISDGLASSIYQLSELSCTGYQVGFLKIPASNEAKVMSKELNVPIEELILYFGGDYELLVTMDVDGMEGAQKALSDIGTKLTAIGQVVENEKNTLIKDGVSTMLENRGYEHFRWIE
jgi:thiamine-monophosphate kinase